MKHNRVHISILLNEPRGARAEGRKGGRGIGDGGTGSAELEARDYFKDIRQSSKNSFPLFKKTIVSIVWSTEMTWHSSCSGLIRDSRLFGLLSV